MKFGVCVNMLRQSTTVGSEFINSVAECGYDYVELPLGEMMLLCDSEFQALKKELRAAGIPCYACNNFFCRGIRLVGPDVDRVLIQDYYARAIERAGELGARRIVFGSPWAKEIPVGFSKKEAKRQMVRLCREIGALAEKYGIFVVLEHNNKTETNYLNQLWEVGELADAVSHPNICLLVDYYHLCMEDEPMESIVRYGKNIQHAHFARHQGRGYPRDLQEDQRYLPFRNALREVQYDQTISIEAYSENFAQDGPATLCFFRSLFAGASDLSL